MKKPEAILFDFGDTLCRLERFDALAGNRRCLELAEDSLGLADTDIQRVADRILRAELAKHRLLPFFDPILASSEYGIRKPNPLLFELAAGVTPDLTFAEWNRFPKWS